MSRSKTLKVPLKVPFIFNLYGNYIVNELLDEAPKKNQLSAACFSRMQVG
jgi:hypothetical protein